MTVMNSSHARTRLATVLATAARAHTHPAAPGPDHQALFPFGSYVRDVDVAGGLLGDDSDVDLGMPSAVVRAHASPREAGKALLRAVVAQLRRDGFNVSHRVLPAFKAGGYNVVRAKVSWHGVATVAVDVVDEAAFKRKHVDYDVNNLKLLADGSRALKQPGPGRSVAGCVAAILAREYTPLGRVRRGREAKLRKAGFHPASAKQTETETETETDSDSDSDQSMDSCSDSDGDELNPAHLERGFRTWDPCDLTISWGGGDDDDDCVVAVYFARPAARDAQTVLVVLATAPEPDSVRAWLEVGGERRAALELLVRGPTLLFRVDATAAEMWGDVALGLSFTAQSAWAVAERAIGLPAWRADAPALPLRLARSGGVGVDDDTPRWTSPHGHGHGRVVFALPTAAAGFLFCAVDVARGSLRVLGLARLGDRLLYSPAEMVPALGLSQFTVTADVARAAPAPQLLPPGLPFQLTPTLVVAEHKLAALGRELFERDVPVSRDRIRLSSSRAAHAFSFLRVRVLDDGCVQLLRIEAPSSHEKGASGGRTKHKWGAAAKEWTG